MATMALWANLGATLVLTGVIWTIQVVHYPLMADVGRDAFAAYEAAHTTRIGAIVWLPWAVQGAATATLLLRRPAGVPASLMVLGAALAALTVLVTLVASIPAHTVLAAGFDEAAHRRLVTTNWWRTAAWTGHAVVMAVAVAAHLRSSPG